MERNRQLVVPRGQAPERLDRFLAAALPELSRSQLKRLIEDGQVLVDGQPGKAAGKLRGGETLQLSIPAPTPVTVTAQDIPLQVLFEDRHLVVIDKPAGLVVHPAPGHSGGTLVNALLHHCRDLAGIGGELRPGIVHRLDKDTSGVMVATKDDATHLALARQFKDHTIQRRYVALVYGTFREAAGVIDRPIGRHPTERKKMSTRTRSGRRAVTHWQVLESFPQERLTLLELRLETGRTHQIRVHLSELKRPLVGDPVYGRAPRDQGRDLELERLVRQLGRQFLHARLLGFTHPVTGQSMEFSSPLPAELERILRYLHSKHRLTVTAAAEGAGGGANHS